jgi:hypothetical protein
MVTQRQRFFHICERRKSPEPGRLIKLKGTGTSGGEWKGKRWTADLRSFVINPGLSLGQITVFTEIEAGAELGESFFLEPAGDVAEDLFDGRVLIRLRGKAFIAEVAGVTVFIDVDIDVAAEHSSGRIESFDMMNFENHFILLWFNRSDYSQFIFFDQVVF